MMREKTVSRLARTVASPRGCVAYSALETVIGAARFLRRLFGIRECPTPESRAENADRVLDSIPLNARELTDYPLNAGKPMREFSWRKGPMS